MNFVTYQILILLKVLINLTISFNKYDKLRLNRHNIWSSGYVFCVVLRANIKVYWKNTYIIRFNIHSYDFSNSKLLFFKREQNIIIYKG